VGVAYYGYRYYDPLTGRWPSRDPIGEAGGLNLQMAHANNPISKIDIIGLKSVEELTEESRLDKECRNKLENARKDPRAKEILDRLLAAAEAFDRVAENKGKNNPCRIGNDQCLCCEGNKLAASLPPSTAGWYDSNYRTVYICRDRVKDAEMVSLLVHELKHVEQLCPATNTLNFAGKDDCERRMCMELQAYAAQFKYDLTKGIEIRLGAVGSIGWLTKDGVETIDECAGRSHQQLTDMATRLFGECTKK
jgi:hypothetical protein